MSFKILYLLTILLYTFESWTQKKKLRKEKTTEMFLCCMLHMSWMSISRFKDCKMQFLEIWFKTRQSALFDPAMMQEGCVNSEDERFLVTKVDKGSKCWFGWQCGMEDVCRGTWFSLLLGVAHDYIYIMLVCYFHMNF